MPKVCDTRRKCCCLPLNQFGITLLFHVTAKASIPPQEWQTPSAVRMSFLKIGRSKLRVGPVVACSALTLELLHVHAWSGPSVSPYVATALARQKKLITSAASPDTNTSFRRPFCRVTVVVNGTYRRQRTKHDVNCCNSFMCVSHHNDTS